jgi:A/G-specific adenine glycosylase
MPWKGEKNPYFIWLSEIILQQTRVEQGLPYYLRFVENYPTVNDLANAPSDDVMKLWEGLGYYSRARNLHQAAKYVAHDLNGVFPSTYERILELKGVGHYTAAAIASFAYNLPYAVLDGNVYRVLARYLGANVPIDSREGEQFFRRKATDFLDAEQAGNYNQAIMDFGATHCTPKQPKCKDCPMQATCQGFLTGMVEVLPVKSKKLLKKERFFNYFILTNQKNYYLRKRVEKDIWQDLYEFPMFESNRLLETDELAEVFFLKELLEQKDFKFLKLPTKSFKQTLSHQYIFARFWEIEGQLSPSIAADFLEVPETQLKKMAFPKIIDTYFQEKTVLLELF